MTAKDLIVALEDYRSVLQRTLKNYVQSSDSLTISHSDDPIYRQKIIEIRDLLYDALGRPNSYATQILSFYNDGIRNYLHSPSYQSVQNIIGVLGAVITRVKRNPAIAGGSEALGRTSSKRVFIGHGHSVAWKDIKDFIADRLGLEYEEFNREPVTGKSNKERLEEMLGSSGFAIIIMTAEDQTKDGKMRARENVVHEAGLFQGRLGFERAIILREEGCEEFSNIEGLVQLQFPREKIMAISEEIRRTLEREAFISKSNK
jgi:predicted nucleotide-binding protein